MYFFGAHIVPKFSGKLMYFFGAHIVPSKISEKKVPIRDRRCQTVPKMCQKRPKCASFVPKSSAPNQKNRPYFGTKSEHLFAGGVKLY